MDYGYIQKRPNVPLIPVSVKVTTGTIDAGWWPWDIIFTEENYSNGKVVPWDEDRSKRREFKARLFFSDVFGNDVLTMYYFLSDLQQARLFNMVIIDEEGSSSILKCWYPSKSLLQLQISSDRRKDTYSYNLLLNRESFYREMIKAFSFFWKHGGWIEDSAIDNLNRDPEKLFEENKDTLKTFNIFELSTSQPDSTFNFKYEDVAESDLVEDFRCL